MPEAGGSPSAVATLPPQPAPYLDYDPAGYVGQVCTDCSSWSAQVVRDDTGMWVVREWHHPRCVALVEWL